MPERIWAPWRLVYIENATPSGKGCIFVDLPASTDDRQNLVLYRGKKAFVMLNRFPYTNGHLMIAPYKHTADLSELDDDELLEINKMLASVVKWLTKAFKPEGFNIGVNLGHVAGAGIPTHVHWHIVPRWNGDTNFMTVVGDVRVIPQSLEDTYDRLRQVIESE